MGEASALGLLKRLAQLSREQAVAMECDRLEAVALVTRELEETLREAAEIDWGALSARLGTDPALFRAVEDLCRQQASSRLMLRLGLERLGRRRAGLSRAGTAWYAGRPRTNPRPANFDLKA